MPTYNITVQGQGRSITVDQTTNQVKIIQGSVTGSVDHTELLNIGVNTHAQIDAHIADLNNPHNTTHASLSDVGVYSHAVLDAHVDNTNIHFLKSEISILDLLDVDQTIAPQDNWVLTYDDATGKWHAAVAPGAGGGATQLNELSDVTITGVTGGEILVYVAGSGDFENKTLAEANIAEATHDHLYTNTTPMPEDVGGAEAGTTFTNQTISQMFDQILYPYQYPSFSAFSFGQSTPIEVGATVAGGAKTVTWTTVNPSNVQVNSIEVEDLGNSTILASGLADDGSESVTFNAVQKTSATTHIWQIRGTNSKLQTFSRNVTITWQWRIFYGESALTSLTEADVEGLRANVLRANPNTTYAMLAGNYKWICYPTVMGLKTTFKDAATGLDVAMEAADTVSITNPYGVIQNYYCHRTTNQLGGAINIIVSN